MKEMPKEIWLHNVTDTSIIGATWLGRKVWDNDVEYVHKDAFIDKACIGIEKLLSGYIIRNFNFGDSYDIDKLIADFKDYMKGN